MTLKRVLIGEPITSSLNAQGFNALVGAVEDLQNREARKLQGASLAVSPPQVRQLVRNDTGVDQAQFNVLGIGGMAVVPAEDDDEFRTRVIFSGVVPQFPAHRGQFGVLLQPAAAGDVVAAAVSGAVQVQINDTGAWGGTRAEIVHGETGHLQLVGLAGSSKIVYRTSGSGPKWGVVIVGSEVGIFPVETWLSGGAQGTASTPATWLYTIKEIGGRVLAVGLDPTVPPHRVSRQGWGAINGAQIGLATYEGGELVILQISEVWEPTIHNDARVHDGVLKNV